MLFKENYTLKMGALTGAQQTYTLYNCGSMSEDFVIDFHYHCVAYCSSSERINQSAHAIIQICNLIQIESL